MTRKPKPAMPGAKVDVESMIRVDHAGEYGAVRIYEGQLAVLRRRKDTGRSVETISHMAELEPVWRVAGFALGAVTAAMGEKAAYACTAAVEEVIDAHYAGQIAVLGDDDAQLKATVTEFRAEEAAHRRTALDE